MRYDDPELRDRLAADYVLGTMPRGARRRFEQLIERDATLAAAVAAWESRLAPLDEATPEAPPPQRVWREIERRLGAPPKVTAVSRRFPPLAWWRGLALAAVAGCAGLGLYIGLAPGPSPTVLAVLSDKGGAPTWIATAGPRRGEVRVVAIGGPPENAGHSFELWAIAGGAPHPLGLLPPQPAEGLMLSAAALPPPGGALAISQEPPGGSPTGLPTGPVLYQGKVLPPAR